MSDEVREAVHLEPAWRARSNFIIASAISSGTADMTTEQLWARRLADRRFEICCIPFFIYDLALGDVVETDAEYMVRSVVQPSGHHTFRVSFGQSFHPRDDIAEQLVEMGPSSSGPPKTCSLSMPSMATTQKRLPTSSSRPRSKDSSSTKPGAAGDETERLDAAISLAIRGCRGAALGWPKPEGSLADTAAIMTVSVLCEDSNEN